MRLNDQIERTLLEINTLSTRFDNTASRIEHTWNTELETDITSITSALFYHELILPTEATLQFALDDMDRYINSIDTTIKNNNKTTSSDNHTQYQTDEDETSITSDIAPNTEELEAIYQNNSTTPTKTTTEMEQPVDMKHKQVNLIELLLRYVTTTTTTPGNDHIRNTLPILPPWPDTTNLPLKQSRPQLNSNHHNKMPILPPRMEIPTRPHEPPPLTWTHHSITSPTSDNQIEFNFHTHQSDADSSTPHHEHTTFFATIDATTPILQNNDTHNKEQTD